MSKRMREPTDAGHTQGHTDLPDALERPATRRGGPRGDGSLPNRVRRIFGDEIERLRAGLLSDLGGPEAVTTGEMMLINGTLEAHAIRRLLGHRILCRGACDRKGEVKPAVLSFFTALNSERLNLVALGLKRRAKAIPTLDAYLREKGRGAASEGPTPEGEGGQK